jgi:hypothetical protein
MNSFLLDAQALGKRFIPEQGTPLIDHLFARCPRRRLLCAMIAVADVVAMFVRRRQQGLFTPVLFSSAMLQLLLGILQPKTFPKLRSDNALIRKALDLLDRYELPPGDAIVLQTAINRASRLRSAGNELILVTPDPRLLPAAQGEGLRTFDPEAQTQADLDALLGP